MAGGCIIWANDALMINKRVEQLDQYDYQVENYIEKRQTRYALAIGQFLINFSCLEHELGRGIAEIINERSHGAGYQVIRGLRFIAKVELFKDMYTSMILPIKPVFRGELSSIVKDLGALNKFRNQVAHSDWSTLTKDYYVRTSIITDDTDGYVKFQLVKMTPTLIKRYAKKVESVYNKLWKFVDNIQERVLS